MFSQGMVPTSRLVLREEAWRSCGRKLQLSRLFVPSDLLVGMHVNTTRKRINRSFSTTNFQPSCGLVRTSATVRGQNFTSSSKPACDETTHCVGCRCFRSVCLVWEAVMGGCTRCRLRCPMLLSHCAIGIVRIYAREGASHPSDSYNRP